MTIVFTTTSVQEAFLIKALLAENGIETIVENEFIDAILPGIPFACDSLPRVRVIDAALAEEARRIIATSHETTEPRRDDETE